MVGDFSGEGLARLKCGEIPLIDGAEIVPLLGARLGLSVFVDSRSDRTMFESKTYQAKRFVHFLYRSPRPFPSRASPSHDAWLLDFPSLTFYLITLSDRATPASNYKHGDFRMMLTIDQ